MKTDLEIDIQEFPDLVLEINKGDYTEDTSVDPVTGAVYKSLDHKLEVRKYLGI